MANYNTYLLDKKGKTTTDLKKGDLYVSVSTVLKMEGKDLITWALRRFGDAASPLAEYQRFMDEVSALGTAIHSYIEHDLKGIPFPDGNVTEKMLSAISAWHDFRDKNKIELIASEKIVFSPKWRIAGTTDAVIKLNGKMYVADIKTGGIYPSAYTQLAIYKACLMQEPKSKRIKGIEDADLLVLGVHRDKSIVECLDLSSYHKGKITIEDELKVFHSLRYIWFMRNIKSKKWEPVIKNMQEILSPLEQKFKEAFSL